MDEHGCTAKLTRIRDKVNRCLCSFCNLSAFKFWVLNEKLFIFLNMKITEVWFHSQPAFQLASLLLALGSQQPFLSPCCSKQLYVNHSDNPHNALMVPALSFNVYESLVPSKDALGPLHSGQEENARMVFHMFQPLKCESRKNSRGKQKYHPKKGCSEKPLEIKGGVLLNAFLRYDFAQDGVLQVCKSLKTVLIKLCVGDTLMYHKGTSGK